MTVLLLLLAFLVAGGGAYAIVHALRFRRDALRRLSPGMRCPECGYSREGLLDDRCPECGNTLREAQAKRDAAGERSTGWSGLVIVLIASLALIIVLTIALAVQGHI